MPQTKVKLLYRISRRFHEWNLPVVAKFFQKLIRFIFAAEIPPECQIGRGSDFAHAALGVCINGDVKIGENCTILQNVTIGARDTRGCPTVGDNVFIGAGAVILGNVLIGNNVNIGANAVVINSVPDHATVVGIPAKPIRSGRYPIFVKT